MVSPPNKTTNMLFNHGLQIYIYLILEGRYLSFMIPGVSHPLPCTPLGLLTIHCSSLLVITLSLGHWLHSNLLHVLVVIQLLIHEGVKLIIPKQVPVTKSFTTQSVTRCASVGVYTLDSPKGGLDRRGLSIQRRACLFLGATLLDRTMEKEGSW